MTVTSFLISSALYASSLHYTAERENMEGNRTHCPLPSTGSPPFPSLFSTFHSTTTTITAAPLWTQGNNQPHSDTSNVPLNVSKVFFFSKPEMRAWKKKNPAGYWADAGKHLHHQLVCSDTRLPDTLPNKDHRRETSTYIQRTKTGRLGVNLQQTRLRQAKWQL